MAITAKARALRAEGRSVIGFGAGEPDFPTPPHVVEAARAAALDPANHRYSPVAGLPELRSAVAAATRRHSGLEVEPAQVLVTNGGKQAVYLAFQVLLDPGDEVLVPAPYWVTYPASVRLAEGVPVPVPTDLDSGFRVSVDDLEAARTSRTKALVFVSPSNPTGAVYDPEQTAAIGRWAAEHGIWVVADEIYDHLVYGSTPFTSIAVAAPEVAERTLVVNGVSKTYAMTGWRVGWLLAAPEVVAAAGRIQGHLSSNTNNVAQRAALAALEGPTEPIEAMRRAFDRRRRLMWELLSSIPGFEVLEPAGAFYAFPRVEGVLGGSVAGRPVATSLELAEVLLEAAEVAVVPGEAFGAPGHLRLSFALSDDELVEGVTRIRRVVEEG
ncbi:MAG TPA: pyridoxal phosphate-dependent aminotransferase [Actinobacteria bacterium]|nr:pyridoxal phosphate-dependent aminotransferase [Actinomycetota bacterium]